MPTLRERIRNFLTPVVIDGPNSLNSVSVKVDDSPGWGALTAQKHDYDTRHSPANLHRRPRSLAQNPVAWRIIAIITDYVIGDRFTVSSRNQRLKPFHT